VTREARQDFILMGRFGSPHGVRGDIRLQSFTADPRAIASYGPLFDNSGARRFVLANVRPQVKDMLVARVEGVGDRAGAQALTGVELFLPRECLPPPEEDEFYLADLEGLRAETADGAVLGRVVALRNFGAGDILEVAPLAHDPEKLTDFSDKIMRKKAGGETLLFPFTKAVVPIVDVAGGRVVIAPPEEMEGD
jgi:16S rRNA processing protein RimM